MKVAIAADHAGMPMQSVVADAVRAAGHEPVLLGPDVAPPEGIDYPLMAKLVGDRLAATEAERGVLVCGSGAGVTIAANKLPGVRAAYAADHYTGHQMVEHDHVNVLTLGARVMGPEVAIEIVTAFVDAVPSTEERHLRRLGEVLEFERERSMNAATRLHDAGQSLWLDNITRELAGQRHARPLHRRPGRHRAHVEPDDLRQGDHRERRLRRPDPRAARRRASRPRRCSSSSRSPT